MDREATPYLQCHLIMGGGGGGGGAGAWDAPSH